LAAVPWAPREQMNHLLFIRLATESLRETLLGGVLSTKVPPYLAFADHKHALWLVGFVRNYSCTLGPAINLAICDTILVLSGIYVIDQIRRYDTKNVTASVVERKNQAKNSLECP